MPRGRLHPSRRRAAAAPPRVILFWIAVIMVVATLMTAAAPWILPVRIIEGPIVQLPATNGVTLVWYTTRPTECTLTVSAGDQQRKIPATSQARRHLARVDGLEPGTAYTYSIAAGRRPLLEDAQFQTDRLPGQRYDFFLLGDSGRGTREQYSLAADMTRHRPQPDFLVHTGDLVYSDGARHKYDERFFVPYRFLLRRVAFWPCLGNHDVDAAHEAKAYQEVFELPQNGPAGLPADFNYWFDYATSRVAVVDTTASEEQLRTSVAPWLQEVLADPAPEWRFVVLHHPPYTGGKYQPDERVQRTLVPVIDEARVDIVFSGHDHMYQRTHPLRGNAIGEPGAGTVYVITAAGGAALYEPSGPRPAFIATLDHEHFSFTHVAIEEDTLTLRQVALGGSVLDEFTLAKPARVNTDSRSAGERP
jgi:3',5'-cyclic AMP phosphodiesterase CpdA